MGRNRILPDKATLERWKREGLTHPQMVERVYAETGEHVTVSAISVAMHRYGLTGPAKKFEDELPWRVRIEHTDQTPARILRLLGRRRAGEKITDAQATWLDGWLARLAASDAVIAYDSTSGFHLVEREPGDRTDIPVRPYEVRLNT